MTHYWIGILGGLIGSILTVVVTKLLDIFQSSKQHKYELETKFFERKLNAAETAMTQFNILYGAMINLGLLYERMQNASNEVEDFLQNQLYKEGQEQIELATNSSFLLSNSITLYFDLDSQFSHNKIIKEFYDSIGALGALIDNDYNTYIHYRSTIGTNMEQAAYQLYQQAAKELDNGIEKVSANIEKFNHEIQIIMKQIRAEMKKFEY